VILPAFTAWKAVKPLRALKAGAHQPVAWISAVCIDRTIPCTKSTFRLVYAADNSGIGHFHTIANPSAGLIGEVLIAAGEEEKEEVHDSVQVSVQLS
jgi:hypothetical protein